MLCIFGRGLALVVVCTYTLNGEGWSESLWDYENESYLLDALRRSSRQLFHVHLQVDIIYKDREICTSYQRATRSI